MAGEYQEHSKSSTQESSVQTNWCNFCGYTTDNLNDYLSHSCIEVIEAKGQTVIPTGQNECR